jgi:RimJ/RimL family protein N-acetyltransferase
MSAPSPRAAALAFDTERLQVRPLASGDETLYCHIYTDADTLRHIGAPLPAEAARRSFAAALRGNAAAEPREIFLVPVARAAGLGLGITGLRAIDRSARRAEAGLLLTAAARGQGLARELLAGLVQRGFACLPLDEIYVDYAPHNLAMARLARRTGFVVAPAAGSSCRATTRRPGLGSVSAPA